MSFLGPLEGKSTSWGITKLRVDRGHAIDVGEVLAVAAAGVGAEKLELILRVMSCF